MQRHLLLVPLDGTELGMSVLNEVRHLFSASQTRLLLLRLVTDAADDVNAQVDLEAQGEALRREGYEVAVSVLNGDPADEIVHIAEREGIDLIAMATQDLDPVHRLFVGDVARDVLGRVRIPVLLLNPDTRDDVMSVFYPKGPAVRSLLRA